MFDHININKNNEINSIIDNYIEFKDLIINYLKVNHKNLLKIKDNDLNIVANNDFYAYINK